MEKDEFLLRSLRKKLHKLTRHQTYLSHNLLALLQDKKVNARTFVTSQGNVTLGPSQPTPGPDPS